MQAAPSEIVAQPPKAAGARETVVRPPPGLARGRWEAPPWAFALVVAAALLGGLAWILLALRTRRRPR